MLRPCIALSVFISFAQPLSALAENHDPKQFNEKKFSECLHKGTPWSNCVTVASPKPPPTRPSTGPSLPTTFLKLLEDNPTVGARIWTPSAVEQFQLNINRTASDARG